MILPFQICLKIDLKKYYVQKHLFLDPPISIAATGLHFPKFLSRESLLVAQI